MKKKKITLSRQSKFKASFFLEIFQLHKFNGYHWNLQVTADLKPFFSMKYFNYTSLVATIVICLSISTKKKPHNNINRKNLH